MLCEGDVVERYRIVAPLGAGGMGLVFEAIDTRLNRSVALKVLRAEKSAGDGRARILREARAAAIIEHPNIVSVFDVGETSIDGSPVTYLAMELVRGKTLRSYVGDASVSTATRTGWLLDVASALAAAHDRGLVHRDVKPENVMVREGGTIKVLDFGIARQAAPPIDATGFGAGPTMSITSGDGAVAGTPCYMAPEQMRGEELDGRADQFSWGVMAYELLSGSLPWGGDPVQAIAAVLTAHPAPPSGVSPWIANVIMQALEKERAARFESMRDLCDALLAAPSEDPGERHPENPYRGLRTFDAEHRAFFFGRTTEARVLLERLRAESFVVVAGDSGVGKSSLCLAAVRSAFEGQTAVMVPGKDPLAALARALGTDPHEAHELPPTLLVIDQLEEIFTRAAPDGAAAFARAVHALYTRCSSVRVLCTLRGDFITRTAALPGLGEELTRALYILLPLGERGLRTAITGPAARLGFSYEEETVNELVSSTRTAGLAPLQFALAELWEARDERRRVIPPEALAQIGGVGGALARHADAVLATFTADAHRVVRRMLLAFITPERTSARRRADEIEDPQVLERLVAARLVATRHEAGEPAYELGHEALIDRWGTLRGWIEASAAGRAASERLRTAVAEWHRLGKPSELLWSGRQLAELEAVVEEHPPRAAEFVRAARRRARRARALRAGLVAAGPLVVASLIFGALRIQEDRRRSEELVQTERGALASALAREPGREMDALVAGVEAVAPSVKVGAAPPRLALSGLLAALAGVRRSLPLRGHTRAVTSVRFSPDGSRVLTTGQDAKTNIFDAATGELLHTLPGSPEFTAMAEYSPDGARIALLGPDNTAMIIDADGRPIASLAGHTRWLHELAFSPDGARVATASEDMTARVWNARTGRLERVLSGHTSFVASVAFSPDGRLLVTGSGDRTARVWDLRTGESLHTFTGFTGHVWRVRHDADRIVATGAGNEGFLWDASTYAEIARLAHDTGRFVPSFSPDGARLVTAGGDRTARVWDARTGRHLMTLHGHSDVLRSAYFSRDGERVITSSRDRTVRVWDAATGASIVSLIHANAIDNAVLSPAGDRFATGAEDGTVQVWTVDLRRTMRSGHTAHVYSALFSPDGARVVTAGADRAGVWDARTGVHLATLAGHQDIVRGALFAPDGSSILTYGNDRVARLFRPDGELLRTLEPHAHEVWTGAFSPDGSVVATGSRDGAVKLWEARSGVLLRTVATHEQAVESVAFAPEGDRFVTASSSGSVALWQTRSGATIALMKGHTNRVYAAGFSRDGTRIASASADGTVRLWDGRTGALQLVLRGHSREVSYAYFVSAGERILTVCRDGTARLWDATTGAVLHVLAGHTDEIWWGAVSLDGKRAVTASRDTTARIWDLTTGEELHVLRGHAGELRSAEISPDGTRVATAGYDASVRLWDTATGEALVRDPGELHVIELAPADALREACAFLRFQPEGATAACERRE